MRCSRVSVLSLFGKARLCLANTFLTDHLPPLLLANALSSAVSQSSACIALLKGFSSWVEIDQQEAPKFIKETQMLTLCPMKTLSFCKDAEGFTINTAYRGNPFVSSNIDMSVFMGLVWCVLLSFCLEADLNYWSNLKEWKQPKNFQPDITDAVVASTIQKEINYFLFL